MFRTPLWPRLALAAGCWLAGGAATAFELELPIRCTPGADCEIQNFFDHDPGPGWQDYACGRLSYDGHDGTDFRLLSLARMAQGVEVLAAAAGVVVASRDGEADLSIRDRPLPANTRKLAGNGVRIDHGGGWITQYSHLRRGSVRVRRGQSVAAGEPLGWVGLSGQTEFPHLHFSVEAEGRRVDPFAPAGRPACDTRTPGLWSAAARAALVYRASGVLLGGFADRVLSERELQGGEAFQSQLSAAAPAIVFQLEAFGLRRGDLELMSIRDGSGAVLVEGRQTLSRDQAVRRAYLGQRRPATGWPVGIYVAEYQLRRGAQVAATVRRELRVGP